MLQEEQKGYRKRSRGIKDLLYIDRTVIREVKSTKKNLGMTWIDYNKAYDKLPYSWIKECLDLFGVATKVETLLVNSMEKWRLILYADYLGLGM